MSFSVLLYHEIRERRMLRPEQASPIEVAQRYADNLPAALFVSLEQFSEQMSYLAENGYHTLSLSEIAAYYYENAPLPEKSVLLTFDDCYQSIGLYAYPILKEHRFHAVAFVVTGWLLAREKRFSPERSVCMTKDDLVRMSDVFEYANHSHGFHTRQNEKTSAMMTAGDDALLADLNRCGADPLIGVKDAFAYPFGLFSQDNVDLLRRTGFRLAFTCAPGQNDRKDDPLLLKRNVIPHWMGMEAFRRVTG